MKSPQASDCEIKEIDSLLEHSKFDEALSKSETCLQKADKPPSFRAQVLFRRYEALRGLRKEEPARLTISDIVKSFDKSISNSTNKEKADLKAEKGRRCTELSLLRTAESEISGAVKIYQELQDERERKVGMRKCYNVLAEIYFRMGEYKQAIKYLKEYRKLVDQTFQEAIYSGMLGRVLMLQGELRLAEENLLSESEIYQMIGNETNLIKSWLELCYLNMLQRKFKKAEEFLKKAYKKIEGWSDETIDSIHTKSIYYEFSGYLAYTQGNFPTAHECYQKVFDMMDKIIPMDDMISQTNRFLAELLVAETKYDEALTACENGWEAAFETNGNIEIGAIHRVWGQIYSAIGEKDKARDNFEESISLLNEIGARYELGLAYWESGKSNAFEDFERDAYLGNAKRIFKKMGIEYYVNSASELQRSLPKRELVTPTGARKKMSSPLSSKGLCGMVKDIDEDENIALVEFDVGGTPLEMDIELSYLEPIKADYTGARIEFIAKEKGGRMITRFKNLGKPENRTWREELKKGLKDEYFNDYDALEKLLLSRKFFPPR